MEHGLHVKLVGDVWPPTWVDAAKYMITGLGVAVIAWALGASSAHAAPITFNSTTSLATLPFAYPGLTDDWLLIGTAAGSFGTTVSVNSGFELGAHLPLDGLVPTDGSPDIGDVTKPAGATSPSIGIGRNGDTALTNVTGTFNFQDIDGTGKLGTTTARSGIYGDTGVQCSQGLGSGDCIAGNSNNFFNSAGTFPMPNSPLSSANGIVAGTSATLTGLRNELTTFQTNIPLLPSSGTLTGGTFSGDLTINLLNAGIHVLDVSAIGGDWNLGNFDIVVNGPANAYLIIRLADGINMLTSNSWIGTGTGGIGTNNILFYTDQNNNNGHFNFNNTVFNGVSFWDLSGTGSDLAVSNGQGCAQFVSDQIVMNNVRFNNCAFTPTITTTRQTPEPATLVMLSTGLVAAGLRYRRKRSLRSPA